MLKHIGFLLAALIVAGFASVAAADDWTAVRLRGQVLQLVGQDWQPLHRGDVVSDSRVVRTLGSGHVDFVRGAETVSLGPDTQMQIFDKGGAKPFTTVKQYFGSVAVEAQVQNVQHFAVETPYLAAVVKGTRFVVTSDKHGTRVSVQRGHVEIDDRRRHRRAVISIGQTASVSSDDPDAVEVAGTTTQPPLTTGEDSVDGGALGTAASGVVSTVTNTVGGLVNSLTGGSDDSGNSGRSRDDGKSGNGKTNSGKGSSNSGKGSGSSGSSVTVSVGSLTLSL